MPRYDYRCPSGHVTDTFRPMACSGIDCPVCGSTAERIISRGAAITRPETDTRGMFRRFTEATAEMGYKADRIEQSTGQTVTAPDFWHYSKERAQQMISAGEAPNPQIGTKQ